MESRLPKPSGLRKPTQQTVVPMNRIKRENTTHLLSKTLNKALSSSEPYRDLTNVELPKRNIRALSPECASRAEPNRAKLRRSRSACDILALKKAETVVPPKLPRLNEVPTSSLTKPTRFVSSTKPKTTITTAKTTKPPTMAAKPPLKSANKPVGSAVTSTATTGAGKPINKRIPPYDFKARYNDLLEKHKALKEKHQTLTDSLENFESLPEQLEECKKELQTTKELLQVTMDENKELCDSLNNANSQLESVTTNFTKCRQLYEDLKVNHDNLTIKHDELLEETKKDKELNKKLSEENEFLNTELEICKEQLFRSNMERKVLHNDLLDLKGNIRVFCRVRPPLSFEESKPLCGWNYVDEATVEIVNQDLLSKNKQGAHLFNFDYVFHPGSKQEDVFEMVSPLIQSAMDGYNICIFAYGQTGSGKTFTMDGVDSNVGVIPRTVDLIFQSVENYKHLGWNYEIKVTFLEIYNEVLYDLLSNEQKDMEIRMDKNDKKDIYVSNITEEYVQTADRLRELMQIAKMNRATAATAGNERSSRSHAVTKIQLFGFHAEKKEKLVGTINLVDLAGSESPKTSIRMTETKNINRSLSELTNVILALLQKQDHIPYRNSKLTHLLMPSLGGNSKTLMFINVAPFLECYVESLKSLRFAASVNNCKMAKAKRNRVYNAESSSSGSC